jgi:uncharacterized damage-inducible protein DinB
MEISDAASFLAYLAKVRGRTHEQPVATFAGLEPADLQRKCVTPGGAELAVWKWLRAMIEHEIHHRGQIYVYLGMLGIHGPPLYGLTSEEVRARSAPPEHGGTV